MIQLTGEATYNPRRLIQKVINGLDQEAFEDRTTWLCSACDLCQPACPQKIHVSGVMGAVKDLAIEAGAPTQIHTARVNQRTCVACGICAEVCPYEAISLAEHEFAGHTHILASVDAERCMACGLCAASCRSSSIELLDEFASEALMDNLWRWMHATAPTPISIESIFEWSAEPSEIER
jgi:heterodisulfide reductase subunit C